MSFTAYHLWNESTDNHKGFIQLAIKLAPITIAIGFLGTNKFLLQENLDPVYLLLKFYPPLETFIQSRFQVSPEIYNRDIFLLLPLRFGVTFAGCLIFWALISGLTLGLGAMMMLVHDMMQYLLEISMGKYLTPMTCHASITATKEDCDIFLNLDTVIIRRYKETQIFVRLLNNLAKEYTYVLLMITNLLGIVITFAAIQYASSIDFIFTVYMPMLSILLNISVYIILGMMCAMGELSKRLVLQCRRRIRTKKNERRLNSLYLFHLKVDQINVTRSFITGYFKHCTDNVVTLLLSAK